MTEPEIMAVPVGEPLQWQIEGGRAGDGTTVLRFSFSQGSIATQLVMSGDAAEQLIQGARQVLTRERSGLILPGGVTG